MPNRQKILILERDDFLREIIGNLLHKQGGYILNGSTITKGIKRAENHHINTVILGTSCEEYKGKETLHYVKKQLNQSQPPVFFMINTTGTKLDFIESDKQILIEELSIEKILEAITV
jgi:DNA-binding response OmpR family regulator